MSAPSTAVSDPAEVRARLLKRAQQAVEAALAAGADQAEAFTSSSEQDSVGLEKGDLQLARSQSAEALGLRVFSGARMGFGSTNQFGGDALTDLATEAVALARMAPEDPAQGLETCSALGSHGELVSADLWNEPTAGIVRRAGDLLELLRACDPRISLDSGSVGASRSSIAVASSAGAASAESDAALSYSLFGMAIDGDDVGGFDYTSDSTRKLAGFDESLALGVQRFGEGVLGNLGAGASETYRGPVLFRPEAFVELFLSPLIGAINAKAVQRGRSALASKLGESIGVDWLQLLDDPADLGLAGACAFDREGVPARPTPVVTDGRLKTFLHNAYTARVEGRQSTGHASGGTRSVPGIGCHGLCMAPGSGGTEDDLLRQLDRGLLVGRFSGSVDPVSGDFSGVAKSARWVAGGQIRRPVGETLLAGNAFELLGHLIAAGSTAERIGGSMRIPSVLVDQLSVTAG